MSGVVRAREERKIRTLMMTGQRWEGDEVVLV